MSHIHQNRGGPRLNWDTHYPDGLAELAIDGISEVMVGAPTCKLTLFQTRPVDPSQISKAPEERVEHRQAVLLLTMNLQTLIENFSNVLGSIAQASPQLRDAILLQQSATRDLLDRLGKGAPTTTSVVPSAAAAPAKKRLVARPGRRVGGGS